MIFGKNGIFGNKKSESPFPVTDADSNQVLAAIAQDYLKERKSKRRWGTVIKLLIVGYLLFTIVLVTKGDKTVAYSQPHTAMIELNGVIGTEVGISAKDFNQNLRQAFEANHAKGIILKINSPGGTPVQAAEINQEILRLRVKYPEKPFHAVVSDVCASGGYFIAVAADSIYANRSSIVGSIGVRMDGFGFVEAMKKFGVERRLLTAGNNKGMLDPFSPVSPQQKQHAEKMLRQVHQHFIDAVKTGRGDRIADNPAIYSGLFWSGEEAKTLGLIDEFGNADMVAREVIGAEKIVDYTARPNVLDKFARQLGASVGQVLTEQILQIK